MKKLRKFRLPSLLVLVTLFISCENESLDSDGIISNDFHINEPSVPNSIENAPDQSGFFVTRGENVDAIIFIDFKAGLTASIEVDNAVFCDGFPNNDALQMVPTQQVDIPNDPDRFQIIQKGEAYFEVYEGVINEFLCDFIQHAPLIASGTASTVLTDNDLTIYNRSNPKNINAFGFTAKGILTDQNGDPVNFKANYRGTWDGQDFTSLREVVKISLN